MTPVWIIPGLALPMLLLPAALIAQASSCIQFDQEYFTWVGIGINDTVVTGASNTIRLSDEAAPWSPGSAPDGFKKVDVPAMLAMRVDPTTVGRWEGRSYWTRLTEDSLLIAWRNGSYGPVFRMAEDGGSFEGVVRQTTDVVGVEPSTDRALGMVVTCPNQARPDGGFYEPSGFRTESMERDGSAVHLAP